LGFAPKAGHTKFGEKLEMGSEFVFHGVLPLPGCAGRDRARHDQTRDTIQDRVCHLVLALQGHHLVPAFANGLGGTAAAQISRLAASESDLYMLEAEDGKILHAAFTGQSLQLDNAFNCQPGTYAGYQVGTLVDLLALPKVNAAGATVLGVDATGNLLYCAPGQVPQAIPLPSLPNTNWGRITSFVLDGGDLYVVGLEGSTLKVHYQGACGTCPSSISGTLAGIEGLVRRIDPYMEVIAV